MSSQSIVSFLLLTLLTTALAYPLRTQRPLGQHAPIECETVSTYTTEWFLANTLPAYRHELHRTALFYTRGTSAAARELADASPGTYTTIWDVWPCYLYDDRQEDDNALRCIHHDPEHRRTFYESMSRAFARMARDSATVMHTGEDYDTVPVDGIWGTVELPALQLGTDVHQIHKTDETGDRTTTYELARDWTAAITSSITRAINEVRAIFRKAKWTAVSGTTNSCAMNIWDSPAEHMLDSLW